MRIGIGIDTGGTCTDAVAYDLDGKCVLAKGKSPTTREDLRSGIEKAMDCLPDDMLRQFSPRDGVPRNLVKQGFYNWPAYQKKFGFVSLGPIRSLEATANYIGKYITKELAASPIGLNKHLYLCSKGLKRAEVVKKAHIYQPFSPDYSNEHVATKVFESPEAALRLFLCPSDYALPVRFEEVTAAIPRKEVTDYGRHYAPYYPC